MLTRWPLSFHSYVPPVRPRQSVSAVVGNATAACNACPCHSAIAVIASNCFNSCFCSSLTPIFHLTTLHAPPQSLSLENNRLEVMPEAIGDLPNLVRLDISNNSIRFLPPSMGNFKKIQRIDCSNNLLPKVPPSMGHLKLLKEFNLRYNSLEERYAAKVEEGLSRLLAFLR